MAVATEYDGSKIEPLIKDGTIRVTKEWLVAHATRERLPLFSPKTEEALQKELISWSICPAAFYFNDTPNVRRLLGLAQAEIHWRD